MQTIHGYKMYTIQCTF